MEFRFNIVSGGRVFPVIIWISFPACDKFSIDIAIDLGAFQRDDFVGPAEAQPDVVGIHVGTQHCVHHQDLRHLVEVEFKIVCAGAEEQGQDGEYEDGFFHRCQKL